MANTPSATKKRKNEVPVEDLQKRLVLTGADIVSIGESAELLVGGKNYNTADQPRTGGTDAAIPCNFLGGVPYRSRRVQGLRGTGPFHGR